MAGTSPSSDNAKKKQEAIAKAKEAVANAQTQEQKDAAQAELAQAEQMPN